ncbi:unnamed protein product [Microthlaspi erraticum]|uniref:C2H2-type domain-containing protein n=1 Tax=Microthlaspi erraticum TaxID=1685480 RepID=A0A6D2HTP4_9BRAS|nr:unnamed protein product [Microthlaspi erraticum]
MALVVDQQQPQDKHYCRICKKGFACGRALGGHMRTHGISEDISNMDDDDEDHTSYEWAPNASKRMYALRTNPNRLKSCRVCENCGIEFSSWKSFLEHGKCNLEEADSDTVESFHESDFDQEGVPKEGYEHNRSKRKRSFRAKVGSIFNPTCPSTEEEDLAHCLMMLSNGIVEPVAVAETEESCAFAIKDEEKRHHLNLYNQSDKIPTQYEKAKLVIPKGLFECKACKKVFNSHQALGGHRASHKKVKGCFAAKLDHTDDNEADQVHGMITQKELYHTNLQYDHQNGSSVKKKAKVHECSICYRVFSSGQALGGHKRCHWITSKYSPDHAKFDNSQFYNQADVAINNISKDSETLDLTLDLNFNALGGKPQNNQISQEVFLSPWVKGDGCEKDKTYTTKEKIENLTDDETVTKTKFAKLVELKEMNTSETSSHWLQVGLGSTSSQAGSDL